MSRINIVNYNPYPLIGNHVFYKYLVNERGLTHGELVKYNVGFALDFLVEKRRIENQSKEEVIPVRVKKDSRGGVYYPVFSNRIMFPIKNKEGQIIAFSGRSLDPNQPKYFNSSESYQFEKRKSFFGLVEAMNHPKGMDLVMIVEGQIDAIKGNRYLPTLAPMGKFTPSHAIELKELGVKKVLIVGDRDKAGYAFTRDTITSLLEVDILPTVGVLKGYNDMGETNGEPLKDILEYKTVYEYLIARIFKAVKKNNRLENEAMQYLSTLNPRFLKASEAYKVRTLLSKEAFSSALEKFYKLVDASIGEKREFTNIENIILDGLGFTLHKATPVIDDTKKEVNFFINGKEFIPAKDEQDKLYKISEYLKY